MDKADLEGLVDALYREAGFEPDAPQGLAKLVRSLWRDPEAVQLVPRDALRWTPAMLAPVNGRWRIFVRRGVPCETVGFLIGHELGHWALRREGARFDAEADEERAADYVGAALVATHAAFRRAVREHGTDVRALAEVFGTTESLCLLRLGETTGRDLALVRPGLVRVRGQLNFVWPDEPTIRGWATGRVPPGIAKTRGLDGDRRRVALLVDEAV